MWFIYAYVCANKCMHFIFPLVYIASRICSSDLIAMRTPYSTLIVIICLVINSVLLISWIVDMHFYHNARQYGVKSGSLKLASSLGPLIADRLFFTLDCFLMVCINIYSYSIQNQLSENNDILMILLGISQLDWYELFIHVSFLWGF